MSTFKTEWIEAAIDAELDRQARAGARRIDVHTLAERIGALVSEGQPSPSPKSQMRSAKRPAELNASNDG